MTITLESEPIELLDFEITPPCETRWRITELLCGNPSAYRVRGYCPVCDNRRIKFLCADCYEHLRAGVMSCGDCAVMGTDTTVKLEEVL